ncbi:hypothetical protein M9458_023243, partial [Cirrhinus mrigala]
DLHEPSQVAADHREPSQVSIDLHEPRHVPAVRLESSQATLTTSRLKLQGHGLMMASVLDPPLVSVRAANIPVASAPYKPTINEVLPPAAAVPLMAVAIWCVWAAHCAPEVLSDHKSAPEVSSAHKSTPEVPSDHKSAPVVPSDHKPTPEVSSAHKSAPEVPSVYNSRRSDPEASSDRESAPEASSVHESTPVPLEVAAPAAEPPEGAAFPFGLSARQVTAELATNKLSPSLLVILSASAVPTLPRSQFMTRLPAPPWRAPALT